MAVSNISDLQVQLGALYRQHAALTTEELWLRYYCLGGCHTKLELELYLDGAIPPPLREHNLIALALNEHFMDLNLDCFVPFMAREESSERSESSCDRAACDSRVPAGSALQPEALGSSPPVA
jgi:hypothetical protein